MSEASGSGSGSQGDSASGSGTSHVRRFSNTHARSSSAAEALAALPDPSLPAPALAEEEVGFTAADLIARQAQLEREAREAVPFSFTKGGCTYEKGYIRQPVYACRTCGGGGVCAGCSVGCHAEHDLVELFAKRSFRCDCGTLSLDQGGLKASTTDGETKPKQPANCQLRPKELAFAPENDENRYTRNWEGKFCRCERGERYDPETEDETMFQCLVCEDWFHETCTSLTPPVAKLEATKSASDSQDPAPSDPKAAATEPVPLINHDAFDLHICDGCVRAPGNEVLRRYAGANGWGICVPAQAWVGGEAWDGGKVTKVVRNATCGWDEVDGQAAASTETYRIIGGSANVDEPSATSATAKADTAAPPGSLPPIAEDNEAPASSPPAEAAAPPEAESFAKGTKRELEAERDDGVVTSAPEASKKAKVEGATTAQSSGCTLPPLPPISEGGSSSTGSTARLDLFLSEDFRDRICRCVSCLPLWYKNLPFLLAAEETYSPPRSEVGADEANADGQSDTAHSQTSSSYDLGLAALSRLPRERMLDSLQAYGRLRDALFEHLRPYAGSGKAVDGDAIRAFFEKQQELKRRD